jgi:hypothetical protein
MEDFRFSSEKMPSTNEQNNPLEEILRKGAQKLLQQAIEFEYKNIWNFTNNRKNLPINLLQ